MHKLSVLVAIVAVASSLQTPVEAKSKYLIPNFMANWFKAVEYCNHLGRRLAMIENRRSELNLFHAIKTSDVFYNVSTRVWIGANDLAEEGNFHWRATGRRVQYTNWVRDNPDDYGGDEDCVEVGTNLNGFQLFWQWNDDDCNRPHYFACEEIDGDEDDEVVESDEFSVKVETKDEVAVKIQTKDEAEEDDSSEEDEIIVDSLRPLFYNRLGALE